ncbi:MAG: 2-C-methyl-D-erythritol 4-phosphate cytidylyltransferase [Firmicutes bacterium]|nr:2-C-methyl-D-erythritol 4-phosphate cytidylyltransferase [Bacillota bacterium]
MNLALIVAAGKGKRMGNKRGKQFLPLLDKPVLAHTLISFEQAVSVDEVIVITTEENLDKCRSVVDKYNASKVSKVVVGGKERQDSVYQGLVTAGDIKGVDVVMVHDGARPLVDPDLINRVAGGLVDCDGAIAGIPAKDTIKLVKDDFIVETLDRMQTWQIQTPQAFHFETLLCAHEKAKSEGFYGTDDSVLVERIGGRVKVVLGSEENIKITTPADLIIAEAILKSRVLAPGIENRQKVTGKWKE